MQCIECPNSDYSQSKNHEVHQHHSKSTFLN